MVASAASAATVTMYSAGSMSIKGFGNDTTTGTTYPYNTNAYLGIPFGQFCNQLAGSAAYSCYGSYTGNQVGRPLIGWGNIGASETTAGALSLPEGLLARKLGTPPSTYTYGTQGTKFPGTGAGAGSPGGSFSYYPPYLYSYTYADMRNAAGSFFAGVGGNFTLQNCTDGVAVTGTTVCGGGGGHAGRMTIIEGDNKYGGTMRLLGHYLSTFGYQRTTGVSVNVNFDWLFSYAGGGNPTKPYGSTKATVMNYGFNTVAGTSYSATAVATGFPWTTGIVSMTATRGPFFSVMVRSGYDTRTAPGTGNIQMVAPMMSNWTCLLCPSDYETAGIGVMHLQVPEPTNVMMLLAGISLLGLVYRVSHRS